MMWKRFLPLCCLALMATLALAPLAQSTDEPRAGSAQVVSVDDGVPPDVTRLTESDRELLRAAEQSSDPGLAEQRGGSLVVVVLLVILIILIVD